MMWLEYLPREYIHRDDDTWQLHLRDRGCWLEHSRKLEQNVHILYFPNFLNRISYKILWCGLNEYLSSNVATWIQSSRWYNVGNCPWEVVALSTRENWNIMYLVKYNLNIWITWETSQMESFIQKIVEGSLLMISFGINEYSLIFLRWLRRAKDRRAVEKNMR